MTEKRERERVCVYLEDHLVEGFVDDGGYLLKIVGRAVLALVNIKKGFSCHIFHHDHVFVAEL